MRMRLAVLAGAVLTVLAGCSSPTPKATTGTQAPKAGTAAEATPVTEAPKAPLPGFGDGTHAVGKDIQPGTYRAADVPSMCYWSRQSGFGGSLEEIIANENTSGPTLVTIAPTDVGFETKGCGRWTTDLSPITASRTAFDSGTYVVGTDIAPGTYRSAGGDGCYWARLTGFGGTLPEVIANTNATGPTVVTIAASDGGFTSNGCEPWTP